MLNTNLCYFLIGVCQVSKSNLVNLLLFTSKAALKVEVIRDVIIHD